MQELIDHLNRGKVLHLYRYGLLYNNVIRALYILIKSAIRDNAIEIIFYSDRIVRNYPNRELDEISLANIPNGGAIHLQNMLTILKRDKLVSKYIDTRFEDDVLICAILY